LQNVLSLPIGRGTSVGGAVGGGVIRNQVDK
jgi:hypothetical protein